MGELEKYLPEGWKVEETAQKSLTEKAKDRLTSGMGKPAATTYYDRKVIGISSNPKVLPYREDLLAHEIGHVLLGHGELEDTSDYDHMRKELQAWMKAADIRGNLPLWTIMHVVMNYKEATGLSNSKVISDVKRAAGSIGWNSIRGNRKIWSMFRKELEGRY